MYVHSHWDKKKASRGWFSFRLSIALFIHPLIKHANNAMARNNSSLSRDGRRRRQNQLALANSHSRTAARSSVCTRGCKIMSRDDSKKTSGGQEKCEKCLNFLARENWDSFRRTEAETRHDLFAFGFARNSSRNLERRFISGIVKTCASISIFRFSRWKFQNSSFRFYSTLAMRLCTLVWVLIGKGGRRRFSRWWNRRARDDEVTPATQRQPHSWSLADGFEKFVQNLSGQRPTFWNPFASKIVW